jgi:hypothetical protein
VADVSKRLVAPVMLGTAAATLYTVPAITTATVRCIRLCNETPALAAFTLSYGLDGTGKRIYRLFPVPGRSVHQDITWDILPAGEVIQGYADTANALTIMISGGEST